MADSTEARKPEAEKDAARRLREEVEALVARAPARSQGRLALPAGVLEYETCVEFLPVVGSGFAAGTGELQAAVMATAYLRKAAEGAAPRPVCFAFNGGPGSSSLWLQFGALGPKRVVVPDDGSMPRPPYTVEDNPLSWLAHFDLVFIDPPMTGWSLAASDEARKKLLSVDGDVAALGEVMRLWLTRHRRWGAALYLAGESYGTTRGAALADALLSLGASLAGVVLVSCAMDLQSIVFAPGNHLPYALFLPAYANVAQYHGRLKGALGASPQAAREAAEAFVHETYAAALHAGSRLTATQRSQVATRIAELTGLPRGLVEERNLRISDQAFFSEALREQGRVVGRLDARVTGPMAASGPGPMEFDPGIESILGPYSSAALACYAEVLGVAIERRYETLSLETNRSWNWSRGEPGSSRFGMGFTSTSPDLALALRRNPHLRVLAASGRYDLGTPYSASDWSLAQLDVPPDVAARVTHRYYDAGHMMYTRQADLAQLARDLAAWLA